MFLESLRKLKRPGSKLAGTTKHKEITTGTRGDLSGCTL
jgi:hypothetical protein